MYEEDTFTTEKYDFYFYLIKDMRGRPRGVGINVATIERREVTEDDENEVRSFIEDMGKWEALAKTGRSLLEDLGFGLRGGEEQEKEFGIDTPTQKYKVDYERKDNRILVRIKLTSTESLRRTRGDTTLAVLPLEEIVEQIKNVPKWQIFKKTISELKKL